MALKGSTTEEKIWNYLVGNGLSEYGAAGLMGNLYAESGLSPTNLQNSYEKKLGYTDDTYTTSVDNGDYQNFVRDSAGYGLAQWTFWSRKQNLLTFVRARNKSIGDLETQLAFLIEEMKQSYSSVYQKLRTAGDVLGASNAVLLQFERPADQSRFGTKRTDLSHVSRYVLPEVCWRRMKWCLIQIIALGRLDLLRVMAWAKIPAEQ